VTETLPPPLFDPFAPGFTDDPYPHYAAVREQAPVYQHPFGFWLLTSYAGVSWLLRAGLSVEDGNVAADSLLRQMREEMYGDGAPRASARSMLDRDAPDHTRLRRLVSKAFTPRAIQALRPRITGLVDGMLDAIAAQRRVDLVDALAFPLPFRVIAEMLGTPPADHERIRQLSGTVVRSLEPVADPELVAAIVAADEELTQIAAEMIAWKRANPADDLLTALIHAEDDGDMLDDEELVAQTLLLYIAGHETTVNLIAGGTLALLATPISSRCCAVAPPWWAMPSRSCSVTTARCRRAGGSPWNRSRWAAPRSRPARSSWPASARRTGTRTSGARAPPS
jgi:cytochrome P450